MTDPASRIPVRPPEADRAWVGGAARIGHFLIRSLAILLDVIFFGLLTYAIWRLHAGLLSPLIAFFALAEVGYQLKGSLGKSILGLSIAMHSRGQFYVRETVGKLLSTATFGIGFLLALGPEETTFHDLIAKTSVKRGTVKTTVERRTRTAALLAMAALSGFLLANASTLFHSSSGPPSHASGHPLDAVTSQSPAVLTINCFDPKNQKDVQGSGFLISPDGIAVTNFHVIDGAFRAEAQLGDGRLYQVTAVRAYSRDLDVAVLQLGRNFAGDGSRISGLPYVELGEPEDAKVGDRVAIISSPEGLTNTVSDGLVSAIRTADGRTLLQISAPISPGSSGSPVFALDGKVIGISVAQFVKGQNLNFAVPIEVVRDIRQHESVLAFDQFRLLSLGLTKGVANDRSPRNTAEADMPKLAALSGLYVGVIHNLTADKSATFGIISQAEDGSIHGCMGVTAPLYGSGPFDGVQAGLHVQFTVRHDETALTFDGMVHQRQINGSYTVSSPGDPTQYGTFSLQKRTARARRVNDPDCPTDAEMNTQN